LREREGKMESKTLTFRIPMGIHQKLKMLSAVSGKSMTDILVECIEDRYSQSGLPEPRQQEGGGKEE
jgi:predicted HicB family RNase H-like nuclease